MRYVIPADHKVSDIDVRAVKRLPRWLILGVVDTSIALSGAGNPSLQ
jgi:hypothetical protein